MGWWSELFGAKGLPERTRGPSAPVPGKLREGKKHGLWIEPEDSEQLLAEGLYRDGVREGPFRIWHAQSGELRSRGAFVAGKQHGIVEIWHGGLLRGRCEKVDGKLHGIYRALKYDGSVEYEREYRDDTLWSGPYDLESTPGVYLQRATYLNGERVGPFEDNDWNGRPRVRANYVNGKLDGDYRQFHDGGAVKLEGTYRGGERVGEWRWLGRDGKVLAQSSDGRSWVASGAPLPAVSDDELEKWVVLASAWAELGRSTDGHWFRVEHAVDAFADVNAPLAWLKERIAEREPSPRRTTFGMGWIKRLEAGDGDPRVELLDGIVVDNHHWGPPQLERVLRLAAGMRELCLYECSIEPGVDALFPAGVAWPKLEQLEINECGSLGGLVERLAAASWAGRLTQLSLGDDGGISGATAGALVGSAHLTSLAELSLQGVGKGFAAALGASPLLDRLERLELRYPAEAVAILGALARRPTPRLRELELHADEVKISAEVLRGLADATLRPKLVRLELEGVSAPKRALEEVENARPGLGLDVGD